MVLRLFAEPNQARAIACLAKRLGKLGCARVLIEGGSYQNVLASQRCARRSCRW